MRNKYGNHKISNASGTFDSTIEYHRFVFLSDKERKGEIKNLRRQVMYELIPTQKRKKIVHLKTKDKEVEYVAERSCDYLADFVYEREGREVVEDVKGSLRMVTPDAKIKKKLMLWRYNIEVEYVTKATKW